MTQHAEPPFTHSTLIPGWLVLLAALTALAPLSIDMYLPAFPAIEQGLAAPAGRISLTLAAFFCQWRSKNVPPGRSKSVPVGTLLPVVVLAEVRSGRSQKHKRSALGIYSVTGLAEGFR